MKNKYEVALFALGFSLVLGLLYVELVWATYSIKRWGMWNRNLLELFWLTYLSIAPFVLQSHISKSKLNEHANAILETRLKSILRLIRLLYLWTCSLILFTLFLLLIVSVNYTLFVRPSYDLFTTFSIISFTLIALSISVYFAYIAWRFRYFH